MAENCKLCKENSCELCRENSCELCRKNANDPKVVFNPGNKDFNLPIFFTIFPFAVYLFAIGLIKLESCPAQPAIPPIMIVLSMCITIELLVATAYTFSYPSFYNAFTGKVVVLSHDCEDGIHVCHKSDKCIEPYSIKEQFKFILKLHGISSFL
ncbi:hypothetical protein GCK72_011990 [Caenorhabditis remanei]|uniref:Uncharacterized protein n=1 Tax=Caenorhabditis remanei TaxID=31234 RepID=A0A6A5GJT3_CAERE|nr:hypothetical protein GCK72_011990 [Caenorhabditis remanei]KAF1755540.1 hypothetical protein GCK72_011990 [Caenorhabditis remanei]